MKAVFCHELRSYFTTPVGYVFLIMYMLLCGVVFVFVNIGQEMSASMNLMLSALQLPVMLIIPLLTMRLFAEERRMKTDQLLLTAPVRISHVVLGKLLAAAVLLAVATMLSMLYPLAVSGWAQVSLRQMAAVCLGYFLFDLSLLGIGGLVSSLCTNQITAAAATLGVDLIFYLCEHYALPQLTIPYLVPLRTVLSYLPTTERLGDFANGIISLGDVVYFLTVTALMLFYTCRVLEHRRFAKG